MTLAQSTLLRFLAASALAAVLLHSAGCAPPNQDAETTTRDTSDQTVSGDTTDRNGFKDRDRLAIIDCWTDSLVTPIEVRTKRNGMLYFALIGAESATVTLPPEVLQDRSDTTRSISPHDTTLAEPFMIVRGNGDPIQGPIEVTFDVDIEGCPDTAQAMRRFVSPTMIVED